MRPVHATAIASRRGLISCCALTDYPACIKGSLSYAVVMRVCWRVGVCGRVGMATKPAESAGVRVNLRWKARPPSRDLITHTHTHTHAQNYKAMLAGALADLAVPNTPPAPHRGRAAAASPSRRTGLRTKQTRGSTSSNTYEEQEEEEQLAAATPRTRAAARKWANSASNQPTPLPPDYLTTTHVPFSPSIVGDSAYPSLEEEGDSLLLADENMPWDAERGIPSTSAWAEAAEPNLGRMGSPVRQGTAAFASGGGMVGASPLRGDTHGSAQGMFLVLPHIQHWYSSHSKQMRKVTQTHFDRHPALPRPRCARYVPAHPRDPWCPCSQAHP
jgi:hypothetical protein